MKQLVISAFPNKEKSLVEQILAASFDNLEIIHLSDENLPLYSGEKELPAAVKQVFDKMNGYNDYIFAFPVYWSNMPASLKNLFDWSIFWGVKYDLDSPCEPALENKTATVICSSGDTCSAENQKKILDLVSRSVLELWGVNIGKEIFIENIYNFQKEMFGEYVAKLKENK